MSTTTFEIGDKVRTYDGFTGVIVATRKTMPDLRRPFNYVVRLSLALDGSDPVEWGFSRDEVFPA